MAVACGADFTIALTENGDKSNHHHHDVWNMGEGAYGQLGLGTTEHQYNPALVGGRDVFKEPVVLVAAGRTHTACVTSKGVLFTWGSELGDGFQERRLIPQQINSALHGGQPAVMVSCGTSHTVVLTEAGCVWTCGDSQFGKLGHGNDKLQLKLKLVSILEGSRPVCMSMVASGCQRSVALTSGGQVFTWGRAKSGSLGVTEASVVSSIYGETTFENFTEDRFVPTQVARSLTYHIIHGVYFMHICNGVLRSLPFGLWTFLTNAILSPYCLEQIEAMSWGTEQISLIRTLPRQKDW